MQWPDMLTQVQESIFQVSFDLLLDTLQHVVWAVALVSLKHYEEEQVIRSEPPVKAAGIPPYGPVP